MPNAVTTGASVIVGHWTYSGDPTASNRDAVRFEVGDTLDRDKLVSDEEIAYALAKETTVLRAAARVCDHLAARFSREFDVSADDGRRDSLAQRVNNYRAKAADLRRQAASDSDYAVKPYLGGRSVSDKESQEDDTDRVAPSFRIDRWDNA
jgi:hypothetical protein